MLRQQTIVCSHYENETLRVSGFFALLRAGGTGGHQLRPQVSPRAGNVNNLGAAVQRELIGTVGAGTLEVSVRSDGDDGGSQFFSNS